MRKKRRNERKPKKPNPKLENERKKQRKEIEKN